MTYITKNASGTYYYLDPEKTIAHREDGPAVEAFNGDEEYWVNGKLHRVDGPAIAYANGDEEWWLNGERHRDDGPACSFFDVPFSYIDGKFVLDYDSSNATMEEYVYTWFKNDQVHREDGPAVIISNGYEAWYIWDQPHRMDGPAIHNVYTPNEWYYNGIKIFCNNKDEFDIAVSKIVN